MTVVLFPHQLRRIAELLDTLNQADGPEPAGTANIGFAARIDIVDHDTGVTIGAAEDIVGGAWCFTASGSES